MLGLILILVVYPERILASCAGELLHLTPSNVTIVQFLTSPFIVIISNVHHIFGHFVFEIIYLGFYLLFSLSMPSFLVDILLNW